MSTFELCQKCRRSASRAAERCLPGFSLCKECVEERLESLSPIFRDRSYRAHLARRVWGIPCDKSSNCPEEPRGHATSKVFGQDTNKNRAYQYMIDLISYQFDRPHDDRSITAFEMLAAHHLVSSVKYCSSCLSKAMVGFPEKNRRIKLCNACLRKRKSHIETVHAGQDQFSEPWEKNYRLSLSGIGRPWELNGHEEQGFDELIKRCFTPSLSAGAGEWTYTEILQFIGVVLTAVTAVAVVGSMVFNVRTWLFHNKTNQYNENTFLLAIRNLFNESAPEDPEMQRLDAQFHEAVRLHNQRTPGPSNSTSDNRSSTHMAWTRRTTNDDIQLADLPQPLREATRNDAAPTRSIKRTSSSSEAHYGEYQPQSSVPLQPTNTSIIASGTRRSSISQNAPTTGQNQSSALYNPTATSSLGTPRPTTNRSLSRPTTSNSGRRRTNDLPAPAPEFNNMTNIYTPLSKTDRHSDERPTRLEPRSPTRQSSAAPSNLHLRQVVSEPSAGSTRVPTESRRRQSVPESDNLYGTNIGAMYPDPMLPPTEEDMAERSRSRRAKRHGRI